MKKIAYLILLLGLLWPASGLHAQEEVPTVRAVLFYSPTCPHCHQVMEQVLPPLTEQYGEQLYILTVDVSKERGGALYQGMVADYGLPRERLGVPALVVEDVVLVGSGEIPQRFPAMIEEGLAAGGNEWPGFAGFDAAAAEAVFVEQGTTAGRGSADAPEAGAGEVAVETSAEVPEAGALEGAATVADGTATVGDNADPVGFVLAAILTLLMVGALGYVVNQGRALHLQIQRLRQGAVVGWSVFILLLVGLAVSLYLAYVEINQVAAVCGPVGHCNLVQASPYARIFGIPVAVLGVANYLLLGLLWWGQRVLGAGRLRMVVATMLALTAAGTVFSVYLTLLELFVIEAVCAWCLTSALVITLLMVIVATSILERAPKTDREGVLAAWP